MVARGQKRKLHADYEAAGSVWERQLQSVLDISMDKFHRDQALVEPSLLRSVLINNTLRQVQSEVESLSAVGIHTKSQTNTQPEDDFSASLFSSSTQNTDEDFMAWSSEDDFSLSSAISSILKDLDTVVDGVQGPCVSQRAPLGSIENVTGDGKLTQYPLSALRTERTSDTGSSSSSKTKELMCPSGSHDVALDKLLLDIDTTVFEPENFLQSFSVTADELVKYIPSKSSPPSSSSVCHGQAAWEIHEIEHVMDILMRTCPQS